MRIAALRSRRVLPCVLCPAQEHLRPAVCDVVVAEVACVDGASVDVADSRCRRFVEDLWIGPGVFDDVLDAVGLRGCIGVFGRAGMDDGVV